MTQIIVLKNLGYIWAAISMTNLGTKFKSSLVFHSNTNLAVTITYSSESMQITLEKIVSVKTELCHDPNVF